MLLVFHTLFWITFGQEAEDNQKVAKFVLGESKLRKRALMYDLELSGMLESSCTESYQLGKRKPQNPQVWEFKG